MRSNLGCSNVLPGPPAFLILPPASPPSPSLHTKTKKKKKKKKKKKNKNKNKNKKNKNKNKNKNNNYNNNIINGDHDDYYVYNSKYCLSHGYRNDH